MDLDRLYYMANQIARNLASQGDAAAIEGTRQHIVDFWDPRMKAALLASDRSGLTELARAAVRQMEGAV